MSRPQLTTQSMRLMAILLVSAFAQDALAYCESNPSVKDEYLQSHAVIVGKVVKIAEVVSTTDPAGSVDKFRYQVRVEKRLRGSMPNLVHLEVENDSGRFPMERNKRYLLFVSKSNSKTFIDSCGSSTALPQGNETLSQVRKVRAKHQAP